MAIYDPTSTQHLTNGSEGVSFYPKKKKSLRTISLKNWSEKMASPVTGGEQHVRTPFGKGVSWEVFHVASPTELIKMQVQRIDDPEMLIFRSPAKAPELEGRRLEPLRSDAAAIKLARRYGIACDKNGIVL